MAESYKSKRWELKQGTKIYTHLPTELLQRWITEDILKEDDFIREGGSARWEKLAEPHEFKFLFWRKEREPSILQVLEQGKSYIIKEKKPKLGFELLRNLTAAGYKGLCITRIYPEGIREKYSLTKTNIFWLSKEEREYCISPTDLGRLVHTITEFIKENEAAVIVLEGLEYLITHNDFDKVLRAVDDVIEKVALSKSRLIISVSPEALAQKELALLERNLEPLKIKK